MTPRQPGPGKPVDSGLPSLLLVSMITVLAGVVGVVAVAKVTSGLALVGALVALLIGLVIVIRTMNRQLDDADGL